MANNKYLHSGVKEEINRVLDLNGEITFEDAVDLVEPHIIFDYQDQKRQLAKRVTRGLLASRKDSLGTRKCFAVQSKREKTVYIDIETCKSLKKIKIVEHQLYEKEKGIAKSRKKARKQRKGLEGQLTLDIFNVNRAVNDNGAILHM